MATVKDTHAAIDRLASHVGHTIGTPAKFSVDQREEDIFATLIGDFDPMHNEPGWTFEGGWDSTIVLGFHVLSFLHRNLAEAGVPVEPGGGHVFVSLGLDRVRFVSSLPVGTEAEWSVTLDALDERDGAHVLKTSHRVQVAGAEQPMMVAQHVGALLRGHTDISGLLDEEPHALEASPRGAPIAASREHGAEFYAGVLARAGEWLGPTPWTVVDKRSVDVFNLLSRAPGGVHSDPDWDRTHSPWKTTVVNPLHLLALRSYFMPQVGLPVLTDEWMAAFNYGLDRARWFAQVPAGTRIRDHVRLLEARQKSPGRYLVKTRHLVEAEGRPTAVLAADTLTLFALKDREGKNGGG